MLLSSSVSVPVVFSEPCLDDMDSGSFCWWSSGYGTYGGGHFGFHNSWFHLHLLGRGTIGENCLMALSPFWKNMVTKGIIRVIGQILVELTFMILLLVGTAYLFITWMITVCEGCVDGPPSHPYPGNDPSPLWSMCSHEHLS